MFNAWLRQQTGLTLYDFRVLDICGNSEKEVNDLFEMWIDEAHPIPGEIAKAMEEIVGEGFDIYFF